MSTVFKKKIALSSLLFLLLFISSLSPGAGQKGFIIEGTIKGISEGTVILEKAAKYLGYTFTRVDSTNITDGAFVFKGKVDAPEMYYIKIKGERSRLKVFLENSRITVAADSGQLEDAVVSGSTVHDNLVKFNRKLSFYEKNRKQLKKQLKDAEQKKSHQQVAELQAKVDSALQKQKEFMEDYIKKNSDSMVAAYVTLRYLSINMDLDELSPIVKRFSPEITASDYGKRLLDRVRILSRVAVGKPAPDFTANTPAGEPIKLSSLKGKYVLIDFWASWCGPCRKENPKMKEFYNSLKNQKFEIIGVGLDFSRDDWLKAIKEDKLPWINVSEITGFDGIPSQYGIRSIPYTILLDKEGIIIDKDLRGEELIKRISQLLNIGRME
jgi:thiol-disulfide isomerase/thioredoxin